jgi:hypothetical protein
MNPSLRNLLNNEEGLPASPFRTDYLPLFDPKGLVERPEKTDEARDAKKELQTLGGPQNDAAERNVMEHAQLMKNTLLSALMPAPMVALNVAYTFSV